MKKKKKIEIKYNGDASYGAGLNAKMCLLETVFFELYIPTKH
jgi:hypothetical protein